MKVCLISRLSLELNKLSTEQLIKFINMCKKDIEDSNENCIQMYVFDYSLSMQILGQKLIVLNFNPENFRLILLYNKLQKFSMEKFYFKLIN